MKYFQRGEQCPADINKLPRLQREKYPSFSSRIASKPPDKNHDESLNAKKSRNYREEPARKKKKKKKRKRRTGETTTTTTKRKDDEEEVYLARGTAGRCQYVYLHARIHTNTFVRAVSVSPGAKARNHAAWKKKEEEEGPLRPSGPHRCTEDGPGGTRGGVPHHEPRRGATVVPLRARKREEIAASFVHPPHPLPCLLAARAGGGRRAPWRRRRRWDSRCPEDVQRDNTLFVDPAATSRRTARFSSPLPLLLFSSLSFRSSFSPFIRPSSFHPLSAPWYSSSDSLRAFLFRSF